MKKRKRSLAMIFSVTLKPSQTSVEHFRILLISRPVSNAIINPLLNPLISSDNDVSYPTSAFYSQILTPPMFAVSLTACVVIADKTKTHLEL